MLTAKHYCDRCGTPLATQHAQEDQPIIKICTNAACQQLMYDNPIVGVAGIYLQDKKLLIGKRNGARKTGAWCIPCGYLEHEQPIDGTIREFREETNLAAQTATIYAAHTNTSNPAQLSMTVYYLLTDCTGTLKASDDIDEVQFVSYDDIHTKPIELAFRSDRQVIEQLKRDGLLI